VLNTPTMDGVLVLVKPAGPTSHDMVALVRRLAAARRVGHGGTLDPFASGVLPLFLGTATRMLEYHLGDSKAYRATVCFGASSTTDDLEGELTPSEGQAPKRSEVERALRDSTGSINQTPPAYSAIKVGGRRAYAMARAGQTPELRPRAVTISRLELVSWDDSDPARPIAVLDVECSAGTYVRALARDLGRNVGSGAYLGALVRTASGPFQLAAAKTVDEVRRAAEVGPGALATLLLPPDTGLDRFPGVELSASETEAVARGQFIRAERFAASGATPGTPLRLLAPGGRLVGIGMLRDGRLAPEKVLIGLDQARSSPEGDIEAAVAAERDPDPGVDPDPASPDDV
jgi:tRNA pseudouridine55 synthase